MSRIYPTYTPIKASDMIPDSRGGLSDYLASADDDGATPEYRAWLARARARVSFSEGNK